MKKKGIILNCIILLIEDIIKYFKIIENGDFMPNRINYEPNTVIGSTQILYPDKEKTEELKRSYWICKCLSCGTIRSVRQDNLGRKCKKCGYKNINRKTYDDLTGRVFGNWLVLKQGEKSNY